MYRDKTDPEVAKFLAGMTDEEKAQKLKDAKAWLNTLEQQKVKVEAMPIAEFKSEDQKTVYLMELNENINRLTMHVEWFS